MVGDAKLGSEPAKATEDTLYYIASLTKSFTATSLLSVLRQQPPGPSSITLDTKLASIIPDDFVLPDEYCTTHATIGDAASHLLGIGNYNLTYGSPGYSLRDAVKSLRHLPMAGELRQKFHYANLGYMVLQRTIEEITGSRIEDSHRQHIWGPLDMSSTFIKREDALTSKKVLAHGHSWDPVHETVSRSEYTDDYPLVGGGGIITSLRDLLRYLYAVIHQELPRLDAEGHAELFKPRAIDAVNPPYPFMTTCLYGLGWNVASYRGHRLIWHNGGITGFAAKMLFLPDLHWGVAVLVNLDIPGAYANEAICIRLMEEFLGVPPNERADVTAMMDAHLRRASDQYLQARSTLYPHVPATPEPPPVPLAALVGSYWHPGYGTIDLGLSRPPEGMIPAINDDHSTDEALHAEVSRLMPLHIYLEHITGGDFIAWMGTQPMSLPVRSARRARFSVGDNEAIRWVVNLDPISDGEHMTVSFQKIR